MATWKKFTHKRHTSHRTTHQMSPHEQKAKAAFADVVVALKEMMNHRYGIQEQLIECLPITVDLDCRHATLFVPNVAAFFQWAVMIGFPRKHVWVETFAEGSGTRIYITLMTADEFQNTLDESNK